VERNGARPLNTHQFPICKDRQKFERSINSGCIQGVSASAADRIEGAQPYHASDPTTVPIAALDELDIRDKHRLLIVTVAAASLGETVLTGINEEMMRSGKREPLPAIINFVHSKGAVCEKGIEYFRMVFAEPAPHFHGDAEFKVQVAFEKIGRVNYMPVTVALEAAHRLTGDLIDSFIPEF
jgi:hypothetical protein